MNCAKTWGMCHCVKPDKHHTTCVCEHGLEFPAPSRYEKNVQQIAELQRLLDADIVNRKVMPS